MADDDLVLPSPEGEDNAADTPRFWAPPVAPTSGAPTRSVGKREEQVADDYGNAPPKPLDAPAENVSAGRSMDDAWSHTIAGSLTNAGRLAYLRGEDPSAGELPPPSADEKAHMEDAFFAHLAGEVSPTSTGIQNFAGAVVGSMGSPEAFGGIGSLLVRKLPMLASRPVLTGSLDAAITNAMGDVAAQGINLASGEQEHFEPISAATSAAVGAVVGAGVGHVLGHSATLPHETPAGTPAAETPKATETPASGQAESAAATVAPEAPAPSLEDVGAAVGRVLDGKSTPEQELAAAIAPAPAAGPDAVKPLEPRPGELGNTEPPVHEKDIVNPLDRDATPEEKVAHLQRLTEENEPIVADLIKSIDEEFGTTSKANKKAPENILTKAQRPSILERKPWFNVEHIRDSYRFKTILEDVRDLPDIVSRLDERGIEIVKRDTDKVLEPQEWGWRIAAFDLRMKNGQLVEYYLPVRELEEAKKAGHVIFEKWRNLRQGDLTPEQLAEKAADLQASRDLYQGAWDAYLARSGATESEVRAALSKAATSPASSTGLKSSLRSPTVTPGSLRQLPSTISAENLSAASDTNAVLNGSSRPLQALTNENVTGTSVSDIGQSALGRNRDAQATALLGKQVEKIAPHQVTDASGRTIDVAPIVVEARDLRTSADEGFDASLQPRNRDRAASQAQIRDIASKLDPKRLGYSAEADRGAPIVSADGTVESGNGRVMALRAVYEEGGASADRYRAWLAEQGVDVSAYQQPVLVRQRLTELAQSERQAFTLAANESSTLALSASERAMADARLLPVDTLDLIRNADDLGAAANRDFVRAFVAKLPQTEQGAIVDAHGAISSNGLTRIRNAVLARAYGDSAIIARVAEATSDEVKSISNALVSAAPEWAKMRAEISSGLVRADVDMTDELLEAVKRTADLRSKGTKLAEHLAQQDAFDRLPEPVEAWMRMFYDPSGRRAAGAPKIAERLRFYAEEARKASNDVGLDFGLAPVEARDIQALAAQKGQPNGKEAEGQGVFLRRRPSNGPGDEAGRGHGPAAGPGEPGRGVGESGGALGDARAPGVAGAEPELNLRVRDSVPNQIVAGRSVEDQGTTGGRVQRLEDLARGIVEAVQVTAREGRVTPGALGQFSQRTGNIRVRSIRDLDTVLHEAGHALHLDPENKAKIDPLLKAFADELEPLGAKDGPKGRAEAFAELFRLYAVNRAYAAREFPNATAALDAALKQHFPEQAKALDALRADLDAIHNAPSGELVTADTINVPPPGRIEKLKEFIKADVDPSGRTVYSWMDAAYTSAIDKLHPIYRAVGALTRIAKDNGKKVDLLPADDAYLLARNAPGAHGGATVMLKHGVIPAGGYQPVGPSMADAIEKALGRRWKEAEFNDFGAYLVARRMVQEYARYFRGEIPNPPGKFSLADYKSAVAAFEGKYPSFADAAQDLYAFETNYLQRMFDKGLVSRAYYDAAMARADYVPLVRDMADFADNAASLPKAGGGAGGIMRMSVMKKFGGSDRAVVNPLESIFKKVHDIETVIARNDIVNALDRLAADAGPGSGYIAERVPSNQLVGQKADVIDALKSAGKTAGIDKADLEALILQAEDVLGDSTMATLFRNQPIMSEGGEPIIYGWRGGERYALRLGDGRLGRELYRSMTVMHDVERNVFFMALQISQMALRNGVVKAPDFILSNIIRDQQTALVAGGRKYIPFLSALQGLGDIITGSEVAKAYAGSGGMAAGAITEAIEHSAFGKNVHALNHAGILSKLGKVFEASEAGTRIGLYRSYFKQAEGMGFDAYNAHLYAVYKSQDYIDFRRGGADMDRLRRWVPFLNAAVQGTDREVRALADLPVLEAKRIRGEELSTLEQDRLKDARVALVRTMAFGAVLGTGVAVMNHDDPDYQSAAKYTRNTNWLIKVGSNTWAAIPKPYGIVQAIANAFERASEYAFRKDPALFTEWAAASAESMLPPSQNPLVSVLYDVPANYDRFRERAIVPDYLQKVAPAEQYRPDTSEFAKALGQLTNWSPLKIEYAMRNLGASAALDLLKFGDMLMGKEKPEKQIYDYPVLRRFMKNLERGSAATTAFYGLVGDKAGSLEQAKTAYQTKVRAGERLEAEKYLNGLPDDEKVWTTMSTFADAKEKRLHPLVNARDQVSVGNGLVAQLNSNNVVREDDLDRQNLTSSRREAKPLQLTASSRGQAIEDLQELNMIAARNAMVTVGAKGTVGLPILDPGPAFERLKMHAPEVAAEYQARLEIHHVYDPETVRAAWPEMKQRFLRDGENADVHDLAPRERKHRKQRRDIDATE